MNGVVGLAKHAPGSTICGLVSIGLTVYNLVATDLEEDQLTEQATEVVLIPANTALTHWYFWNVCTAHFVDASLIKVLLFSLLVFRLGVKLEGGWGSRGFIVYILLTATIAGVMSSFLMLVMFFVVSPEYFYDTLLCGQAGLIVAILVGNVRLDENDTLLQTHLKTRLAILPLLLAYSVLYIIDGELFDGPAGYLHDVWFAWFGFIASFMAIRQYDFSQPDALLTRRVKYVDDPFCFDMFFPGPVRPFVRAVSIILENGLAKACGCCFTKAVEHAGHHGNTSNGTNGFSYYHHHNGDIENGPYRPSGTSILGLKTKKKSNPVAERRRARALKALDQKLAQMSREPEVSLDDDDDEEEEEEDQATVAIKQQEENEQPLLDTKEVAANNNNDDDNNNNNNKEIAEPDDDTTVEI